MYLSSTSKINSTNVLMYDIKCKIKHLKSTVITSDKFSYRN